MNNRVFVFCGSCGNRLTIQVPCAITLVCQCCGKNFGFIQVDGGQGNAIVCSCLRCDKGFTIREKKSVLLCCHDSSCGFSTIQVNQILHVLKTTRGKVDSSNQLFFNGHSDLPLVVRPFPDFSDVKEKPSVKIVVPYYDGDHRLQRAIRTWIRPETVFALTDQGCIPPGHGVCSQFFTPKNSKSEGIGKKTKPFLIDLLKRLVDMFPNEQYYGYFNSDIILPPGTTFNCLIPSEGKIISIFHRLELKESGSESLSSVFSEGPSYQVFGGKDGFIGNREAIFAIIKGMEDMILGAPCWDDGLAVWFFKNFGSDRVDLRYKEVMHTIHPQAWTEDEPEARFNKKQLEKSGITSHYRGSINWLSFGIDDCEKRKKLMVGIIQPGRIGDILIVLPIAKFYFDAGYQVFWPVPSEYLPLFEYVNYVFPIELKNEIGSLYERSKSILQERGISNVIDLGIGFGRNENDWIKSGMGFDKWKYFEARVPWEERFNLSIIRNLKKEKELQSKLGLISRKDKYVVTHSVGSKGGVNFNRPDSIEITPIPGFTIFDWIEIIENSDHIYCVDSCAAHLVNELNLKVGNRTFKLLPNITYSSRQGNVLLPTIDWSNEQLVPIKRRKKIGGFNECIQSV